MRIKPKGSLAKIAALWLIALVAIASGCGGGGAKASAKELMRKGDAQLDLFDARGDEAGASIDGLFSKLFDELSARKVPDPVRVKNDAEEVIEELDKSLQYIKKARASFEKILKLKGAGKYGEYADLLVRYADVSISVIAQIKDFLKGLDNTFSSPKFDIMEFTNELQEFGQTIEKRTDESNELRKKAEALKKDESL